MTPGTACAQCGGYSARWAATGECGEPCPHGRLPPLNVTPLRPWEAWLILGLFVAGLAAVFWRIAGG